MLLQEVSRTWKFLVCGHCVILQHFINIILGYPSPPPKKKKKIKGFLFWGILKKLTNFVSGIDFTPKHFRIACLIWTSLRSDTVTSITIRVANWLIDSVMTSQGLGFT